MIDELIQKLSARASSSTVFNPYSNQKVANNLKLYFEYMYNNQDDHVVLVGEAPGYAGCRITGIPFTSGVTITHSQLPVFISIKERLFLDEIESEQTATIVWEHLEKRKKTPVFWNSFPFHPHYEKKHLSNRAPTSDEIKEGEYYIKRLIDIFKPHVIAAIGRKGEKALKNIFPDEPVVYIRHPSRGGKNQFLSGIDTIL